MGRIFFNSPLLGSIEIIKNSVVAVTFMQFPLAIYSETMLKTTILYGISGKVLQKAMRTLSSVLGFLFFLAIVYSSWGPLIEAISIGEYEGEGALRVPTYPVRFLIVVTSVLSAFIYLYLIILDWTGRLDDEGVPIEFGPSSDEIIEAKNGS